MNLRTYLLVRHTFQHTALLTFAATRSPLWATVGVSITAAFGALRVIGGNRSWAVFSGSEIHLIKKLNEKVDNFKIDMVSSY